MSTLQEIKTAIGYLNPREKALLTAEMFAQEADPDAALLTAALERGLREERPTSTDKVIQQALGRMSRVWRRPDGKPFIFGEEGVSAAHAGDFTLAVAGAGGATCDLEAVDARSELVWRDLLGEERYQLALRIAGECSESVDQSATRLWAAGECLKKIGQPVGVPLMLEASTDDGWTLLRSGSITISTCAVVVRASKSPLVLAVAHKARVEKPNTATGRDLLAALA